MSLPRWLENGEARARRVVKAEPTLRDAVLLDYFKSRKTHGEVTHRFYGKPGLEVARSHYESPAHLAAVAVLRARVTDPAFMSALSPLEQAEVRLLAEEPLEFVSCLARREPAAKL
ncbi:hypothetical protein JNW90_26890 [Micromonospora sp. STR1s_5]|nr:hypothetical protein [Micromonospora sp. STR1s_5]